jgi:hypothetical protein
VKVEQLDLAIILEGTVDCEPAQYPIRLRLWMHSKEHPPQCNSKNDGLVPVRLPCDQGPYMEGER